MEKCLSNSRNIIRKLKWILPVVMLLFTANTAKADTAKSNNLGIEQSARNVEGVVRDDIGEPLVGVSVIIQGTTNGTMTNIDGRYSLRVDDPNAVLVFSYLGFAPQSVTANQTIINITLQEETTLIDEVIVIGYGVMKKSDVTGAISSVKADAIARQPVANVASALQGQAPGVIVTSNSGAPGGAVNVRVRGVGTVNNADPLYVVDGMPVSNIDYLSGADIQSMEILKDASATAIYGARGANGVILITTKQGSVGKTTITADAYWGASSLLNNTKLMNGPQWYDFHTEVNKVRKAAGVKEYELNRVDRNTDTDWLKAVTRTGFMQNYGLGISGGTANDYKYNVGINYLDQEGTINKTDYSRISVRQNVEKTLVKDLLTFGTSANVSQSNAHRILEGSNTVGIVNTALKLEPVIPVRNQDGTYGSSPFIDYPNPVAAIDYTNDKRKIFNLVGNLYAELKPIKELTLRSSFGAEIRKTDDYIFDPVYAVSSYQINAVNRVERGYEKRNYYVWENTASYLKTFNEKHTLNAVVGYTNEWGKFEDLRGIARGTASDMPPLHFLTSALDKSSASVTGTAYESALISYLGRLHYDFDDRYMVTFSMRRDGSSKFHKDNRWGNFPSAAVGWKISNEQFFKNLNWNWVSSLKLRGGWGRIGNQNIDDYLFYSLLDSNIQYSYLYGKKDQLNQGLAAVKMGNLDVKWETTETTNIGIDANFLDGRLIFSGEYYTKNTKDMLLVEPLPLYLGYETGPITNIGDANNKGVEFNVEWRDRIGAVGYNLGFNISTVRNRMTSLGAGLPVTGGSVRNGNATITRVGSQIGAFYGYKTDGLIQTQEQLDEVKKLQPGAKMGDVVFVNTNGDNVLNEQDKVIIGNPIPSFIYGINVGADWNGFDINLQFGGVEGVDIFNAMRYFTYDLTDITNKDVALLNYWTPENRNTDIPGLSASDSNDNKRISDRYVEDGSYFRLRNAQIGYTLPISMTRKFYIQKLRFYVTGQNLFTVTKYSGPDPEIGQVTGTNYLSRGLDIGSYPQARTITGGVSITF